MVGREGVSGGREKGREGERRRRRTFAQNEVERKVDELGRHDCVLSSLVNTRLSTPSREHSPRRARQSQPDYIYAFGK